METLILLALLTQAPEEKLPEGALLRIGDARWRHAGEVTCGDFLPGQAVTGGADRAIRFWDLATGRELRRLELDLPGLRSLRVAPDGGRLVATCVEHGFGDTPRYPAYVVDLKEEPRKRRLTHDAAGEAALSLDGARAILGTGDESVLVVRLADGSVERTLRVNPERPGAWRPTRVALSPDGRRIAGASDWGVKVWNLETGVLEAGVQTKPHYGGPLAFGPDGELLFCVYNNGGIWTWIRSLDAEGRVRDRIRVDKRVERLGFDAEGHPRIYDGETLLSHDLRTHEEIRRLALPGVRAFASDGSHAIVGKGAEVEVWDLARERRLGGTGASRPVPARLAFSADGAWLAGADTDLRVWDLKTGATARTIWLRAEKGVDVLPAREGARFYAAAYSGKLEAYDAPAWERSASTPNPEGGNPGRLAWMPDGTVLHAGRIGNVTLYRASDLGRIRHAKIPYDREPPEVAAVGGGLIVFRVQHEAIFVDAAEARILSRSRWVTQDWRDAALSPRGDLAVLHENGRLRFIDPRSGAERANLAAGARTLAFSPDGALLAAGDAQGVTRLLEVATGAWLLPLPSRGGAVAALAFSSDSRRLATAHADATLLVWDLDREAWRPEPAAAWETLASDDALRARGAAARLASDPDRLFELLEARERTRPADERIRAVVLKLKSDDVEERSLAAAELKEIARSAGPALRTLREASDDPEVRRRLEEALNLVDTEFAAYPEARRGVRLAALLDRIGTPRAREALRRLAEEGLTFQERRAAASAPSK